MADDIYIRYLRKYYSENGTINNIKQNTVITFEGQKIKIGAFLKRIKCAHKLFIEGKRDNRGNSSSLSRNRYKILEELGICWNHNQGKEEIYIRYLRKHYQEHGTINDIQKDEVVEFEGSKLLIGYYLTSSRKYHKAYITDPNSLPNPIIRKKMEVLDELNYSWIKRVRTPLDDPYINFLRKYYQEHGTIRDVEDNVEPIRYEGKILDMKKFFINIRAEYKKMEASKEITNLVQSRILALDEMNYEWNPNLTDLYLEFLKAYYQKHGTINDIKKNAVFTYKGVKLRVGNFLTNTRENYRQYVQNSSDGTFNTEEMLACYHALECLEYDWSIKFRGKITNDIYMKYLKWHYTKYGTINNIKCNDVVTFEGKELKIGTFITHVRRRHRQFISGDNKNSCNSPLFLSRYKSLDEMQFIWEPTLEPKKEQNVPDPFLEYLKIHYAKYGTINNIKNGDVVNFEGKRLQIGVFLKSMITKYNKYIQDNTKNCTPLLLNRYATLKELGFDLAKKSQSRRKKKETDGSSSKKTVPIFEKFMATFNDKTKAQRFVSLTRDQKRKERIDENKYTIEYALSTFGMTLNEFITALNNSPVSMKKDIKTASEHIQENITLKSFASSFGYHYKALLYAIKLKEKGLSDEELPVLLNRGAIETKKNFNGKVPNWINNKYGDLALLDQFLTGINFNPKTIYENMKEEIIPLEKAMANESFKVNSSDKYDYLKGLYLRTVDYYQELSQRESINSTTIEAATNIYLNTLSTAFRLADEEKQVITESMRKYTSAIHQYHLFDVAFEKDPIARIEKSAAYGFDDDMENEAYFMPLQFDCKGMVGRNMELFKRRCLVKTIKDKWESLSSEEKSDCTLLHDLTEEELGHINKPTAPKVYEKKVPSEN